MVWVFVTTRPEGYFSNVSAAAAMSRPFPSLNMMLLARASNYCLLELHFHRVAISDFTVTFQFLMVAAAAAVLCSAGRRILAQENLTEVVVQYTYGTKKSLRPMFEPRENDWGRFACLLAWLLMSRMLEFLSASALARASSSYFFFFFLG